VPNIRDRAVAAYGSMRRSPWTERWARLGFATGGLVYILIGVLAVLVAFEHRGRIVGPEGAIELIGREPYGRTLLGVAAAGLIGYAVWRFIAAVSDLDHDGSDWKGLLTRAGVVCSGIAYSSLGVFAIRRALGGHAPNRDAARHWTAELLQHSWGVALIVLVGLILIGAAIAEAVFAMTEKFRDRLSLGSVDAEQRRWLIRFGKWGYLAQSVVLCLIGVFLITAAVKSDPASARGLDGALRVLAQQQYGPWLLGVVAVGLTAYGKPCLPAGCCDIRIQRGQRHTA
jgi:Domain of Unknown Function (DUF1206)